jgi:hypothetical protein
MNMVYQRDPNYQGRGGLIQKASTAPVIQAIVDPLQQLASRLLGSCLKAAIGDWTSRLMLFIVFIIRAFTFSCCPPLSVSFSHVCNYVMSRAVS